MTNPSFQVTAQDAALRAALTRLARATDTAAPLMADIARVLFNEAEQTFIDQADPWGRAWHPLAAATVESREKAGTWPGKILQVHGQLASSLGRSSGNDYAEVSLGKVYGAIHQFGGEAGRAGARVEIPARPILPIDAEGDMPPALVEEIADRVEAYIDSLLQP